MTTAQFIPTDEQTVVAAPRTLTEALCRAAALAEKVGVLAAPQPGELPHPPAALVCCPVAGGTLFAGATQVDLARLDAVCRAAELRLGAGDPGVVVGADPGHAWGRALRRAAEPVLPSCSAGTELPEEHWAQHPQARHWWSAVTARLGVRARLNVYPLTPDGSAFHAVVRRCPAPGAPDWVLGRAVEATAGDAAAFAALATTVHALAVTHQLRDRQESWPSAAAAPIAVADVELAGWEDEVGTAEWLGALAGREPALQSALRQLTGLRAEPWQPVGADAEAVAEALHGCGFTVLRFAPGTR
ncbi:hypothetical protein P3T36_002254 [Kitasatospora sp. MAP12-15]|uniref:hypothetical protein n=1 Tax=unclassified Kitasatospora TaxID=2633591 RepID=UPI0024770F25|nr:hypothetical protein [Kitasatospora sp. MAP12-44]MDH6108826.1 hypothetical protein [Kitasatospora sp. MAP12-44]